MRKLIGVCLAGLAGCVAMVIDLLQPGPMGIPDAVFGILVIVMVVAAATAFVNGRRHRHDGLGTARHLLIMDNPPIVRYAVMLVLAVAVLNLAASVEASPDGAASQTTDGYAITSHGTIIRAISVQEYQSLHKTERRGLMGLVIAGYLASAAAALAIRRRDIATGYTPTEPWGDSDKPPAQTGFKVLPAGREQPPGQE